MGKLPEGHVEIGKSLASNNHYPGDPYHHVRVVVSRRGATYRCHVLETWGSDQGRLEEHGRREVIGRGSSAEEAADRAEQNARQAGVDGAMLAQALSAAVDEAPERDPQTTEKSGA